MISRCSFLEGVQRMLDLCACAVLIFAIGCGGGSAAPAASSSTSNPTTSSASTGGSGGASTGPSSGSSGGSGSSSAMPTAFLYIGFDDAYSYYGNIPHTGHASIAGFSVASDGSLQATPGSPYASPSMTLAANPGSSVLYAASGQTLNVDRINGDGSLANTATLTAQPLSPSIGIYEDLSLDAPAQMLYATVNHGAGTEFYEIYKASGDGSLSNNGSQQASVSTYHLSFTADGKRAYEPFCYHLGSQILGWNVGSDGKITAFDTKAEIPTLDTSYQPCPHALTISPDGKFLAAPLNSVTSSNAALAVYAINADGTLTAQAGSPYPRTAQASDIAWDPSSRYIAIAAKDGLWIYSLAVGAEPMPVGSAPMVSALIDHLAFNKAGTLLFATSASAQNVYVFSFNSSTGLATPAPGSPHKTNLAPYQLVVAER